MVGLKHTARRERFDARGVGVVASAQPRMSRVRSAVKVRVHTPFHIAYQPSSPAKDDAKCHDKVPVSRARDAPTPLPILRPFARLSGRIASIFPVPRQSVQLHSLRSLNLNTADKDAIQAMKRPELQRLAKVRASCQLRHSYGSPS